MTASEGLGGNQLCGVAVYGSENDKRRGCAAVYTQAAVNDRHSGVCSTGNGETVKSRKNVEKTGIAHVVKL